MDKGEKRGTLAPPGAKKTADQPKKQQINLERIQSDVSGNLCASQ